MKVNVNKLKGIIVEKGTTQENVAQALNIHRATFYRRLSEGGLSFTVGDVQRMVEAIPLTKEEAWVIFFQG